MELGSLSSQADNSMGYARILARVVSNTMSFTTLLSVQIVEV